MSEWKCRSRGIKVQAGLFKGKQRKWGKTRNLKRKVQKQRREYRKTFEGSMKKKEEVGKKMMVEMRLLYVQKCFFWVEIKSFIDV